MIRYGVYFSVTFVFLISLPVLFPFVDDSLPLFLFYTPFVYLSERLHDILLVDFLLRPLVVLGMGAVFWAVLGATLGLFLKLWPFRSHFFLRVSVAITVFLVASWSLFTAAQLSQHLQ